MPFNDKVDQKVYGRGIEPAIENLKFKHWRADEELDNIKRGIWTGVGIALLIALLLGFMVVSLT